MMIYRDVSLLGYDLLTAMKMVADRRPTLDDRILPRYGWNRPLEVRSGCIS